MPKRAASPASASSSPAKKPRRSASPGGGGVKEEEGAGRGSGRWSDWPAPRTQMDAAKAWIRECVEGKHRILLVPDKDADGLSSSLLLSLALRALSHPPSLTSVYHLPRGVNIHSPVAQAGMLASFPSDDEVGPTRAIVLDQGSRPGPPLLPPEKAKVLVIDHHLSSTFPAGAQVLSACDSLPVATTSILTYLLCCELVPSLAAPDSPAGMAALLGVYGDLGSSKPVFDDAPWPARLAPVEKKLTKSALGKAVALINAPRRTPQFNVADAYAAIEKAAEEGGGGVKGILQDEKLLEAKERTSAETSRWQGAAPVFSKDGRIAVVKVNSGYQIHPVIATRWCGTLRKAKTLVCVMCANEGYTPNFVHFSCRAPRRSSSSSEGPSEPVDLIAFLRFLTPLCDALSPGWSARVGEDFARGHREATGGIIPREEFEVLMRAVELGVKKEKGADARSSPPKKKKKGGVIDPGQKTTLDAFFKVGSASASGKGTAGGAARQVAGASPTKLKEGGEGEEEGQKEAPDVVVVD
ncbi:hypothetical protein JCM6882_008893 [Rhodosporidiobolus microsporus]